VSLDQHSFLSNPRRSMVYDCHSYHIQCVFSHLLCLQLHAVESRLSHFHDFYLTEFCSVIQYVRLLLGTRKVVVKFPNNHRMNPVILKAFRICEADTVKQNTLRPMWTKHKANHCFSSYFKTIIGSIKSVSCTLAAVSIITAYKLYSFSTICWKTSDVVRYILV